MKRLACLILAIAIPLAARGPVLLRASWYGAAFHGRLTASGERYDRWGFTCASRTLPLDAWVKLTEVRSRRWVFVRVNDRGPFVPGRDLDLSESAALVLGMHERGTALVEVRVLNP